MRFFPSKFYSSVGALVVEKYNADQIFTGLKSVRLIKNMAIKNTIEFSTFHRYISSHM